MGGLLSAFGSEVDVSDCKIDINAEPGDSERDVVQRAVETLELAKTAFETLEAYEDCSPLVKKAMGDPTPDNEAEAWSKAQEAAGKAKKFYNMAQALEEMFPQLLRCLAGEDEKSSFQQKQAVCSKVAELLEFALKFDGLRVMHPTISNDMAYYRRSLSKHSNQPNLPVKDDEASYIMLFVAQMSPMTYALAKGASGLMKTAPSFALRVPKVLALMSNVCLSLCRSKEFDEATTLKLLYAMVGGVIVYDHVSPEGAFTAKGLNTKSAVSFLVKDYPQQSNLANALKYSSLHYSDDSTPSSIKTVLESA